MMDLKVQELWHSVDYEENIYVRIPTSRVKLIGDFAHPTAQSVRRHIRDTSLEQRYFFYLLNKLSVIYLWADPRTGELCISARGNDEV